MMILVLIPYTRQREITGTPARLRISGSPTPDRSRMSGVPFAPAETTTNFDAVTLRTTRWPGWNFGLGRYSTPTARLLSSNKTLTTWFSTNTCRLG